MNDSQLIALDLEGTDGHEHLVWPNVTVTLSVTKGHSDLGDQRSK